MMAGSNIDPKLSLREVVESLLSPEVTGPLDELSDALLRASGLIAQLRRRIDAKDPIQWDCGSLDESFNRSIVLTRLLRERWLAPRARCEYASVCHAAREIVGRLQEALPDSVSLSLRCSPGPAIVCTDRVTLRCLILGLVESAIESLGDGGRLELQVSEGSKRSGMSSRNVLIELRCSAVVSERAERIVAAAYPIVSALRGTLSFQEPPDGGTVIAVRLPCACDGRCS